jgi:hypothetical protein
VSDDFTDVPNNVTEIGPRQRKKRESKKTSGEGGEVKLSGSERERLITDFINGVGEIAQTFLPPKKFVLLRNEHGDKRIFQITDLDEVIPSTKEAVESMVSEFIYDDKGVNEAFALTHSQITSAVSFWVLGTKSIKAPKLYRWLGEEGLCMRRLPFELRLGPTPVFDEMMGRISNAEALQCYIGSLLVDESFRQQYVWLHGQGGEGKGALSRFLSDTFSHTYTSQQTPTPNDRFWTYGLLDKRLVMFPDCNNTTFVTSGLFKSLSGDDAIRIEIKGGKILHQKIRAKYIFFSNEKPALSSEEADKRRVIYCAARKFAGEIDPDYEDRLMKEAGPFLSRCLTMYMSMYPRHHPIKSNNDEITDVISTNEERYEVFLDQNFRFGPTYECSPAALQEKINGEFKTNKERQDFRSFLERRGVKKKGIKRKGEVSYVYAGLKAISALPVWHEDLAQKMGGFVDPG